MFLLTVLAACKSDLVAPTETAASLVSFSAPPWSGTPDSVYFEASFETLHHREPSIDKAFEVIVQLQKAAGEGDDQAFLSQLARGWCLTTRVREDRVFVTQSYALLDTPRPEALEHLAKDMPLSESLIAPFEQATQLVVEKNPATAYPLAQAFVGEYGSHGKNTREAIVKKIDTLKVNISADRVVKIDAALDVARKSAPP